MVSSQPMRPVTSGSWRCALGAAAPRQRERSDSAERVAIASVMGRGIVSSRLAAPPRPALPSEPLRAASRRCEQLGCQATSMPRRSQPSTRDSTRTSSTRTLCLCHRFKALAFAPRLDHIGGLRRCACEHWPELARTMQQWSARSIALEAAQAAELRRALLCLECGGHPKLGSDPWGELQAALGAAVTTCNCVADRGCSTLGGDSERLEGLLTASARVGEWVGSASAPVRWVAARASAAACLLVASSPSGSLEPRGVGLRARAPVPGSSARVAAARCAGDARAGATAAEALGALVQNPPLPLSVSPQRRAAKRSRPGTADRPSIGCWPQAASSLERASRCPAALLLAQPEDAHHPASTVPALERFRLVAASQACAAKAAHALHAAASAALLEHPRDGSASNQPLAGGAAWPAPQARERVLEAVQRLGWVTDKGATPDAGAFGEAARCVFKRLASSFAREGTVGLAAAIRGLAEAASFATGGRRMAPQKENGAAGSSLRPGPLAVAGLHGLLGASDEQPAVCDEELAGLEALAAGGGGGGGGGGDAAGIEGSAAAVCATLASHLRRNPAAWQEWAGLLAAFPGLPAACCRAALAGPVGAGAASLAGWALGPSPLPPAARGFEGPSGSEGAVPKAVRFRGGTFVSLCSLQRICARHARLLSVVPE